jgi:hypothetical protein
MVVEVEDVIEELEGDIVGPTKEEDDPMHQQVIAMLEARGAEEIILGDKLAVYDGTDEQGQVIVHLEDGSYQTVSTKEIYDEMN